jgi:hypothetical protein
MNKYLLKLASWKHPGKFVGYLTGSRKREALSKVRHMEEAVANKLSLKDLQNSAAKETKETTKARLATGVAAGAAVGGAAYGYKRVRDRQKRETAEQYNIMFKESSATGEAAKTLAHEGGNAITSTLKRIGRTTADMMNSAGGGKVKDYGARHGFKPGTEEYKKFSKGSKTHQLRELLRKQNITKKHTEPKARKAATREHIEHLNSLHREQRNARIGLTASGAAGISAYGWKKSRDAAKKQNPYM